MAAVSRVISCYYSLSSPWAYFGGPRLQEIVRRHAGKLILKPFDFQEIVPRTGGVSLRTRPEPRRSYHALELDRLRKFLSMPLKHEPQYYTNDGLAPGRDKAPGAAPKRRESKGSRSACGGGCDANSARIMQRGRCVPAPIFSGLRVPRRTRLTPNGARCFCASPRSQAISAPSSVSAAPKRNSDIQSASIGPASGGVAARSR